MDFGKNIDFFIGEYNIENVLYEEGHNYLKQGFLSKEEFMKICLWKSRRSKKLLKSNSEKSIINWTRKAFEASLEIDKIQALMKLKGVALPMASAILSVTDPKKYPVIDKRCMEVLKEMGLINNKNISKKKWQEYLEVIANLQKQYGKTAREIDKALFAYHRMKLDMDFKNLY